MRVRLCPDSISIITHVTKMDKDQISAIQTLQTYWLAYAHQAPEELFTFFTASSSIIGTGMDEIRLTRAACEDQIIRDFKQPTGQIEVQLGEIHSQQLGEDCVLLVTKVSLRAEHHGSTMHDPSLRSSTVMRHVDGGWKMEHMHLSHHDPKLCEGESWPLTKIEQERDELRKKLDQRTSELATAQANMKVLQGLLPICSRCKQIRNSDGTWEQKEAYIQKRSEADFTHGVCDDCAPILFPDLD